MTATPSLIGPHVRLSGLNASQLPPTDAPATSLQAFITTLLSESIPFIDGAAPKSSSTTPTWKAKGSPKTYAASEAPVHLSSYTISSSQLSQVQGLPQLNPQAGKSETWFCRRSVHRDAAESRTASWAEFVHAFRDHHPETEDAFTPTVIGSRYAIRWPTAAALKVVVGAEEWEVASLDVVEMKHRITPKPLQDRTFPVLQLAATLLSKTEQEFVVVSVPINSFGEHPDAVFAKDKALVVGAYVSIERIRILPQGYAGTHGNAGQIEWIMATASDARGVLPVSIQKMAVPGQVAHDVDMFLSWKTRQRGQA